MIPQVWLDAFVLFAMFALRIALPLAATLVIGKWLEQKLQPPRAIEQANGTRDPRAVDNIIYLHCWDLKHCDHTVRAHCAAFKRPDLPCWLALQSNGGHVRAECLSCVMYKPQKIAA